MSVITLIANTNYSALTVANGDTIALSTFTLNLDVIPSQTGVLVTTASTGKMTLLSSTNYPLTGWVMTAGTGPLIASVPSGTTLGGTLVGGSSSGAYGCNANSGTITTCTGGSASSAHGCSANSGTITTCTGGSASISFGCSTNSGTITTCTGGSASSAHGCNANSGTITTCTGGSASSAFGCSTNNGTITTCTGGSVSAAYGCNANSGTITACTGGSASSAFGCSVNSGTITTCTGGSASTSYGCATNNGTITACTGGSVSGAYGCSVNSGTITTCTGGSASTSYGCATNNGTIITCTGGSNATAYGCSSNGGLCLNITDSTGKAVNTWNGTTTFIFGPGCKGTIPSNITQVYALDAMSSLAVVGGGTTVTVLTAGLSAVLASLTQVDYELRKSVKRIAQSTSPRLEFFVVDVNGAPVTALTRTSVTTASYQLITAGVSVSAVPVSLTSDAARTAAVSSGQFVTISSARGHYAVDCPAGAALATADSVELVVVMASGSHTARPMNHVIDAAVSTRLAPTVSGKTLDVSDTGEAGIDLANVGSPTTTLNLSGLTIKNSTDVKTIVDLIYTVVQLTDSSVSTIPVDVRNAILNRVLAGNHVTAGTVGLLLQFLDALISSRLAPTVSGRTLNVSAAGLGAAELDSATKAQIDAIEASTVGMTGTGARTVTITIDDGTTPLQNAKVRMAEGVNTFTATTDVSGGVVFNLDDATYTVSVTKSGYTYAGTTLVVDGTEAVTYSMTLVAITPPANPGLSALVVLCLDEDGEPEAGVDIDIRIVTVPSGDQNIAYKGSKQTATSDVDGIARLEAVQGSVCEWKRGRSDVWARVTIDGDSSTNVTSIIGSP